MLHYDRVRAPGARVTLTLYLAAKGIVGRLVGDACYDRGIKVYLFLARTALLNPESSEIRFVFFFLVLHDYCRCVPS